MINQEIFKKLNKTNLSNIFLIILFLCLGNSRTILKKYSYLNLDSYSLPSNTIKVLSKCPKILIIGNQYKPYLFTRSGIKVFSGFKRFNSISRQYFFENILLKEKILPYHHLELYERHYPIRLSSDVLNIAGICHVVIPDIVNFDNFLAKNNINKEHNLKKLDIYLNTKEKKISKLNLLEFKPIKRSLIVENNGLSNPISMNSYINIAKAILNNLPSVSKGDTIYIKGNKIFPKRINIVNNYRYIESEHGFRLVKIDDKIISTYKNINNFILIKQEVFSTSKAFCQSSQTKLNLFRVNLIQALVEVPLFCDDIIVEI